MSIDYVDPADLNDDEARSLVLEQVAHSFLTRYDDIRVNARMNNMYLAKDEPRRAARINSGRSEEDLAQVSNTYLPVATGIVDTAKTLLYANLFASSDYMRCVTQDPRDEIRALGVCRHLKVRHRQMGFLSEFVDDYLLEFLLYDFAVAKTQWKIEGRNEAVPVEEPVEIDFEGGYTFRTTRKRSIMRYNPIAIRRSDTELVPNYKCFPDTSATKGFGSFFCIADDVTQEEMMMNRRTKDNPLGIYTFDPATVNIGRSQIFDRISNNADRRALQARFQEPTRLQRAHLIHSMTNNYLITMTGGGDIIRREKTNGMPLVKASFRESRDRFGGMGILHSLERAQLDLNFMVNSRRDFNNYVLNPITIMDQEVFDAAEFGDGSFRPGQLFLSKSEGPVRDKIHTEQPGNPIGGDHQAELAMTMSVMSDVSTIGKNQQGNVQTGRRSAREIGVAAQATGTAMGVTSLRIERKVFEPIYDQQLTMERIHFDGSETARDVGDPELYVFSSPELLAFATTPRMMALGMENIRQGDVEKAQFLQAVSIALGSEAIMKFTNAEELAKNFWRVSAPTTYQRFLKSEVVQDSTNIPPDVENFMFNAGRIPEVKPANDDQAHLISHNLLKQSNTYAIWPARIQQEFDRHLGLHQAQMSAKQKAQAANGGGAGNARSDRLGAGSGSQADSGSPVAETQVA